MTIEFRAWPKTPRLNRRMTSTEKTTELIAVLETLAEWVQSVGPEKSEWVQSVKYEAWTDADREFFTAAWQVIELSMALHGEYSVLTQLMVDTIEEAEGSDPGRRLVDDLPASDESGFPDRVHGPGDFDPDRPCARCGTIECAKGEFL